MRHKNKGLIVYLANYPGCTLFHNNPVIKVMLRIEDLKISALDFSFPFFNRKFLELMETLSLSKLLASLFNLCDKNNIVSVDSRINVHRHNVRIVYTRHNDENVLRKVKFTIYQTILWSRFLYRCEY